MREPVETEAYDDDPRITIKLYYDESAEDPRTKWDHFGTMVCWHDRAHLGDEQMDRHDPDAIEGRLKELKRMGALVLPLYLYEHSGMTMSTSRSGYPFTDPWDAGQVGFIYATPEDIRTCFMVKRITKEIHEKAIKNLEGEVSEYDDYLTGSVYGYQLEFQDENDDGEPVGEPELLEDNCWGLYGYDWAMEEARDAAKHAAEALHEREEQQQQVTMSEAWGV